MNQATKENFLMPPTKSQNTKGEHIDVKSCQLICICLSSIIGGRGILRTLVIPFFSCELIINHWDSFLFVTLIQTFFQI